MSEYDAETEGTYEWFLSKTQSPPLPVGLAWRVKITKYGYLQVAIVNPSKRGWLGRKPKILAHLKTSVYPDDDWREEIKRVAGQVWDSYDLEFSISEARRGNNPYIGTFERKK